MEKVILIRIGEIFLKGRNRSYFESVLENNIKRQLYGLDFKITKTQNRYYLENFDEFMLDEIVSRLTKVFGLHSISIASKIPSNMDEMQKAILDYAPQEGDTFRITCKRADKKLELTSTQFAAQLGGFLLSKIRKIKVDVHNPKKEIFVDIRENGYTYIFSDKIMCAQGMPVSTAGRGILLLSGGFDSPVAGWRMARRGMELYAIHFHSFPHTSEQAKQKVIDLAQILTQYCGKIKLFVVKFTDIQEAIHEYCREDFMITIMRRIMMQITEKIANQNDCGAIITGESLAQVASQTTQSITVSNQAIDLLPVFRPLIGMDKYEIIETAEKIGTARLSELPYPDCCTVFLPKNPVIKPKLEDAIKEQAKIVGLNELINKAIENVEIINLKPQF